jgi:TPP-dependent indolepyruvate ferredoxin oxidoreductase alpha subunit
MTATEPSTDFGVADPIDLLNACPAFRARNFPDAMATLRSKDVIAPAYLFAGAHLDKSEYDGVRGVWCGKAPGLDRAADASVTPTRPGCTAPPTRPSRQPRRRRSDERCLVLVGADPACKSSTLPSSSEAVGTYAGIPNSHIRCNEQT